MKILLLEHPRITPDEHFNDVANAPLSACLTIGYVAALLEQQGHSIIIQDSYNQDTGFDSCFEKLLQQDFSIIGVHAVYFWEHTPKLFEMLAKLKKFRRDTRIVLFGVFPTFAHEEILELHSCVNAIVLGEPEIAFAEIVRAYEKKQCRLNAVSGIAFRDGEIIRKTAPRKPVDDLDVLPFPARQETLLRITGGSILGSRGCHGSCSFCCINPFYGAGSLRRCRSPENIFHEIEQLLPRLDKKYIYFLDADFFGSGSDDRKRVYQLLNSLQTLDVKFGCECRAGSFDEALLAAMLQAGLLDMFIGIESASSATLHRLKKGISASTSAKSVQLLQAAGIEPGIGFIMFEPGSGISDIRENFNFLGATKLLGKLAVTANVLYHREIIFKGMGNFDRLCEAGKLMGTDVFGYEGLYRFNDASVQFMADLMSSVCRRVLRATENARSPICWQRGSSAPSQRVNDYIVSLFSETLRRLELGDIALDIDALLRAEDDALCAIEGLIVEERVCQS